MKMMRCKVNHVAVTMRDGRTEDFQKGMEINFDRVINAETGFTVGQAFEGREECFDPVGAELDPDLPSAPTAGEVEEPGYSEAVKAGRITPIEPAAGAARTFIGAEGE